MSVTHEHADSRPSHEMTSLMATNWFLTERAEETGSEHTHQRHTALFILHSVTAHTDLFIFGSNLEQKVDLGYTLVLPGPLFDLVDLAVQHESTTLTLHTTN